MNDYCQFKKLHPNAIIPVRGTEHAAGFDLFALEDTLIIGGAGNFLVPTGVAVQVPEGTYGRVAMRSGLAVKQHLTVSAGVIDIDYTGGMGVVTSCTKIFDVKNLKKYTGSYNRLSIFGGENVQPVDIRVVDSHVDQFAHDANNALIKYEFNEISKSRDFVYPVVAPYTYLIKAGERFAQLILEKVSYAKGVEVETFERDYTSHIGFGSTGVH